MRIQSESPWRTVLFNTNFAVRNLQLSDVENLQLRDPNFITHNAVGRDHEEWAHKNMVG